MHKFQALNISFQKPVSWANGFFIGRCFKVKVLVTERFQSKVNQIIVLKKKHFEG